MADGSFRKITFETLSAARAVADQLGSPVTALVVGAGIGDVGSELAAYGADRILVADHPQLEAYLTEPYTKVLADIITAEQPAAVLMGSSAQGKDLAARAAARMNAPLAMDCVAVGVAEGRLKATRPMYGGKVLAEVVLDGDPQMVSLRPNAVTAVPAQGAGTVETVTVEPGESRVVLLEKQMETGKLDLTEADIVISGGRGMGGSDYSIVEELAAALGAAVGASRSAVDEGWRPFSDQVGQTGKVVSPSLYIAFGISGAIQHLAGMQTSRVVVAINKDPDAPIFLKADYGIVGNLFDLAPLITAEVKKLKE
jgi:electron transfer flavoprotein alpha subunit